MGQIVLGFRSLLVKLAIFVIMASLLAWALGGTLWPRPIVLHVDAETLGNRVYAWRMTVGERETPTVSFRLCAGDADDTSRKFQPIDDRMFHDRTMLIHRGDALLTAGRPSADPNGVWVVLTMDEDGVREEIVDSRLDVEKAFAAIRGANASR